MQAIRSWFRGWPVGRSLLLAAGYFLTGKLGLSLPYAGNEVPLVWPPTGIALAALLAWGPGVTPGVWLGALLINLARGASPLASAAIATGDMLAQLVGATLLGRWCGFHPAFDRRRDVLNFLLYGGLGPMTLSATGGSLTLCLTGAVRWDDFPAVWMVWWLADALGILIFAPPLLAVSARPAGLWPPRRLAEGAGLVLALGGLGLAVFDGGGLIDARQLPLSFLPFPALIWAALRFGVRGAVMATLLLSVLATWGTARGRGPFALEDVPSGLMLLWTFMATAALLALLVSALQAERHQVEADRARLFALSLDLLCVGDMQGHIRRINPAVERTLGYRAAEVEGRFLIDLVHPDEQAATLERFTQLLHGRDVVNFESRYRCKDGSWRWLAWSCPAARPGDTLLYGVARDVTDRKQAEEAVRAGQRFIQAVADALPHILYVFDLASRRVVYANRQVAQELGYTAEEVQALGEDVLPRLMHPEDLARLPALFARWDGAPAGASFESEYRLRHKDGTWRWFLSHDTVFSRTPAGAVKEFLGTAQDVTARKQAEDQLRASLQEKEALLKEVHHRVKNNLQIVSSLLSLQARRVKDPAVLDLLRESQNRVRSMALVHEGLYRSGNLARIGFAAHIRSLCGHLFRSYGVDPQRIRLAVEIDPVVLDLDQAIPCGLLVNELVSNALKYAFPEGRPGQVTVAFQAPPQGSCTLIVRDDGVGLPPDLDVNRSPSLGLQLVGDLAGQLGGTLTVDRQGGTAVRVCFRAAASYKEPA
jgi:PAS domain S-box-containing protein